MNFTTSIFRIISLAFIFFLFSFHLQAQNEKIKFGKISLDDLKMTRYDKDSSAEAVILADIGQTYFDYNDLSGFMLIHERFMRIKIITKQGYSRAHQDILLYKSENSNETVLSLKASTFNLVDGKAVESKMDKESIFTEESDMNHNLKKFSLPSVKEGSVLDIEYKIQSPFYFDLPPWSFQDVIPERYSEYEVRIPEYFNYKPIFTGYYPLFLNVTQTNDVVNYKEDVRRMATRDVPALRLENFTSSMMNYHTRVEFEFIGYTLPKSYYRDLFSTWQKIVHELLKDDNFGGQIKKKGIMKEYALEIKNKTSDPLEKMIMGYDLIRTSMKWNHYNSYIPTTGLRKAVSECKGNTADINLSLILLLKDLGLKVDPVVLSTRDHGIIREEFPNYPRLNYVIACANIGGKNYLLDATDFNRPYNMLPFRCLNGQGIIAIDDSAKWIDLLNAEKDNTRYFGEFKITPDGKLKGTMNLAYDGYAALTERNELQNKGNDQYIKDLKEGIKNSIIDSVRIDKNELLSPLKVSYNLESQELMQSAGDMIVFNALLGMGEITNPLGPEKREYPVDLGCPTKDSYIFIVDIPEGYTIESLPEKISVALPDNGGTFKFSATQAGNKIAINSVFTLTKTFFVMSEYQFLREFYARMVTKQAENIVLKKS